MAQSARDFIRMGNKAYREKQYDKAETMYLKSIANYKYKIYLYIFYEFYSLYSYIFYGLFLIYFFYMI